MQYTEYRNRVINSDLSFLLLVKFPLLWKILFYFLLYKCYEQQNFWKKGILVLLQANRKYFCALLSSNLSADPMSSFLLILTPPISFASSRTWIVPSFFCIIGFAPPCWVIHMSKLSKPACRSDFVFSFSFVGEGDLYVRSVQPPQSHVKWG